jgi:hopanoid biosynthesis associated protein HpnK
VASSELHLIVTADDFGLDPAINEAVERAFTGGILTAASLMVGQPAAADAVERARRLAGLRVGLHVTLSGARPVLPPASVPELVGADGRFGTDLAALGVKLGFSSAARRQAENEIRAQFEAYAGTRLALDHANAHQHFHMHPFVLDRIIAIGRDYGLRAVRVPHEPLWLARAVAASAPQAARFAALGWAIGTARMRRALQRADLAFNDYLFGLRCTGRVDGAALCDALAQLRPGVAELYLHPATRSGPAQIEAGVGARAVEEFDALVSPAARERLQPLRASRGGFMDMPRFETRPRAA